MDVTQPAGFVLEGHPSDDQKERLQDFLSELMLITRRYQILLRDQDESVQLLDLRSESRLIGVGIVPYTAPGNDGRVIAYEAADSVLDGAWLFDTEEGLTEQYKVTNVFPRRSA